jgi:hypothetical protein
MRLEVLAAVKLSVLVFWAVIPFGLALQPRRPTLIITMFTTGPFDDRGQKEMTFFITCEG